MKFGKVENPDEVDFSLPADDPGTTELLSEKGSSQQSTVFVGCAKWNPKDLKNFYPDDVGDELEYYGSQFNAVELNATFYNTFGQDQIEKWHDRVPEGFKFFPKVNRYISHLKWLNGIEEATDNYIDSVVHFKKKLGTIFLQLRGNFKPKYIDRVANFVEHWPEGVPLAIEFRHTDWFNDKAAADELYDLLEENNIANVITDTAGRRDLLHMRLTNNEAFVRYVGANHSTDYSRLDEWVKRLKEWNEQGLDKIHFFVHQNVEKESPKLSAYFIKKLNTALDTDLTPPELPGEQEELF